MKIDMHVHTSEGSRCAKVDAKRTIQIYKAAGYDAIVLTNHYNIGYFPDYDNSPKKTAENHIRAYETARQEGEKANLKVLLGCELCFTDSDNDYLLYGLDCDFVRYAADKLDMPFAEFIKYKPENILIFQAHPFRNKMKVVPPHLLDGIEVYNGNRRHDARNDISELWADKYSLKKVSGSDFHLPEDVDIGGIITDSEVKNNSDLIKVLKDNNYTLIKN